MLPPSQITPTLTPRFIPETLLDLLKPGRVLTAKVETLAGRLITLWVGGERLEALLSDHINPALFKAGQKIRLKVADLGPPLVLSLLPGAEDKSPQKVFSQLPRLLQALAGEKSLLGLKEQPKAFSFEGLPEKPVLEKALWDIFQGEKSGHPLKRELQEGLFLLWNEGQFVVPFLFGERILWSLLYEEVRKKASGARGRLFILQVFLTRLGFMEARFRLLGSHLELGLYFAREDALSLARKELSHLEEAFSARGYKILVKCEELGLPPGVLLTKEV